MSSQVFKCQLICSALHRCCLSKTKRADFSADFSSSFTALGTMTGGGGKVMKGRMGSSVVTDVSPEEVSA